MSRNAARSLPSSYWCFMASTLKTRLLACLPRNSWWQAVRGPARSGKSYRLAEDIKPRAKFQTIPFFGSLMGLCVRAAQYFSNAAINSVALSP
jgi:hypothetical protein